MATPTPVFPAAVATAAQLKVANNLIQTTLRVGVDAGNTIFFVNSTAGFAANMLVSIDKEISAIAGVVSAPNPSLIVASGGRGFDGTAAATHGAGAKVSVLIDAWHHNALSTEIQAIEAALGPNLSNVSKPTAILSTDYSFPEQTPGGNLIVGSNVITLAPVPKGVNGTDEDHWLYISGGTGSPEIVKIIGGSAVSGAASGTLIFTCANAHSGAWTIRSATIGLQEAYQSLNGASGVISVPVGVYEVFGPVVIHTNGITIQGQAWQNATQVWQKTANQATFQFIGRNGNEGFGNAIYDLQILDSPATGTSTTSWGLRAAHQNRFTAQRLSIMAYSNGIHADTNVYSVFRDINVLGHVGGDGVFLTGGDTNVELFDNVIVSTTQTAASGFHIDQSGQATIVNSSFIGATYGMLFKPATGSQAIFSIDVANTFCDHNVTGGVFIQAVAGGGVYHCRFVQCWFASSTGHGFNVNPNGGRVEDLLLEQCQISDNSGSGVVLRDGSKNVKISGSTIANNSRIPGNFGIELDSGVDDVKIIGNMIGNDPSWGGNVQGTGIYVGVVDHLVITANVLRNNATAAMSPVPPMNDAVVAANVGIDNVIPVVASAATITLGWNPVIQITGTTTITTLNGIWRGRTIRLVKMDAGPVTVGGGGNIPGARTLAQYGSLTLTSSSDGTSWL